MLAYSLLIILLTRRNMSMKGVRSTTKCECCEGLREREARSNPMNSNKVRKNRGMKVVRML